MPTVNPGEIWMTDFGMVAKVRPALILTGEPADDELDLVTNRAGSLYTTPRSPGSETGDLGVARRITD